MKLTGIQVQNFRSINDSGFIKISKLTALVGRNESGKTNLLLALQSLNPPEGLVPLVPIKDFPRHRRISECADNTPVVTTTWELSPKEQLQLEQIFPRAKAVRTVEIGRYYGAQRWVRLAPLEPLAEKADDIAKKLARVRTSASKAVKSLDPSKSSSLDKVFKQLEESVATTVLSTEWANRVPSAVGNFTTALSSLAVTMDSAGTAALKELQETSSSILANDKAHAEARGWIVKQLPTFVFVDEYPELEGHQNISEYLTRKQNNQLREADRNFEKLCKVADLNPQHLQDLLAKGEHEIRNQLANRAGAVVTQEVRRLWKDRALKVRFNPDAQHLDTLISDPNAVYDVEVNLDERSRGFKWFFSFYVTFAADTKGGSAENAILLLDEPGLYLHAASQGDLLRHFQSDFSNQILYTTHSPFMVPIDQLDSVRTVNIAENLGTTVSNDPTGDARTLFPLQAALGFNLAQSLFIGPANLARISHTH